jgi:hypothetical protein
MRPAPASLALAMLCVALGLWGCARRGIEDGVFYGDGYRVVPPPGWTVIPDGRAALSLAHGDRPGAMLINPTCQGRELSRSPEVLMRHLLFGLRTPRLAERSAGTVNGLPADRAVFEGSTDSGPVRGEAIVVRSPACVYDFLYVAPPGAFEAGLEDFRAFVDSLRRP